LENASIQRKAGIDGDAIYIFAVTPGRDGTFAFQVPEDAARDGAGNGSEASPIFSLEVDSTGPEVLLSSFETPMASNSRLIRVKAEFNEPVFGFERGDIAVQRGTVINFSAREDGKTYIFDVRPNRGPV